MFDILDGLAKWRSADKPFALGTVVQTWNSAPRPAGACMAVSKDGEVIGSISGGCVEGAVYELATTVLESGMPELVRYGVSDGDAFAVGLTCGGILDVLVEPITQPDYPAFDLILQRLAQQEPVAVATVTNGRGILGRRLVIDKNSVMGSIGSPMWDAIAESRMRTMLWKTATDTIHLSDGNAAPESETSVFVQSYAPPARMIVFGAIDFAAAVVRIGKFLGYHVTLCDARPVFATRERFPDADELVVDWPHRYLQKQVIDESTTVCVLTHDPKFDIPLLKVALGSPAGYIGVMGSRRTQADRVRRLRAEGITEDDLARLAAPIGLDLGASTPEETAVSIAAEIIVRRTSRTAKSLSTVLTPIHPDVGSASVCGLRPVARGGRDVCPPDPPRHRD